MANNLLASGISNIPHLAVFDEVAKARMEAIQLEALLVYLIDIVDASALPVLAEQFDIQGVKGFGFAQTEAERRDMVKNALELHRFKGTPWAIREALRRIGLIVDVIEERVFAGTQRNGTVRRDGAVERQSQGHWTFFRVFFDAVANPNITAAQFADAFAIIQEYKNARSHLIDFTVIVRLNNVDFINLTDDVNAQGEYSLRSNMVTLRDGTEQRNGTVQRSGWAENIVLTPTTPYTPAAMGADLLMWAQAEDVSDLPTLGRWIDSSQYNRAITPGETVVGLKPFLSSTTLGGLPLCQVPSEGHFTVSPLIPILPTLGVNIGFTFVAQSTGGNVGFLRFFNAALSAAGLAINLDPITGVITARAATASSTIFRQYVGPTTAPSGQFTMFYVAFEWRTGSILRFSISVNGNTVAFTDLSMADTSFPATTINTLFAGINTGVPVVGWAGLVSEFIVSRNNTQTTIDKNFGYLAWKLSLTGLLPTGHPYKNNPPLL